MEKLRPTEISEELKGIAGKHGTNALAIKNLLNGGVREEDVDAVLDISDGLRVQPEYNESHTQSGWEIRPDNVSAGVLARAYKAVNGDLEELESLAERVVEAAGEQKPFPGLRTVILNNLVDRILDGEGFSDNSIDDMSDDGEDFE